MDTYAILNSTDQTGKKLQKTITNVNPNADGTVLKTWIQGLNSLSTNTVQGIARVDKIDILNDTSTAKLPRNVSLTDGNYQPLTSPVTISVSSLNADFDNYVNFHFDGMDVTPLNSLALTGLENLGIEFATDENEETSYYCVAYGKPTSSVTVQPGTVTITIPETDTYASATITVNFT